MSKAEEVNEDIGVAASRGDMGKSDLHRASDLFGEAISALTNAIGSETQAVGMLAEAREATDQIAEVVDKLGPLMRRIGITVMGEGGQSAAATQAAPASKPPERTAETPSAQELKVIRRGASKEQGVTKRSREYRQPTGWGSLLDKVRVLVPKEPPSADVDLTREQARAVYDQVAELDNETLEDVRFFAMDETVRGMERRLNEPMDPANPEGPTQLDGAIEQAATDLARAILNVGGYHSFRGGVQSEDLIVGRMIDPFVRVASHVHDQMSVEQRVLSDALIQVARDREVERGHAVLEGVKDRSAGFIQDKKPLVHQMQVTTLGGINSLYRRVFNDKMNRNPPLQVVDGMRQPQYISKLFTDEELAQVVPVETAKAAARTRLDKFNAYLAKLVSLGPEDKLRFHKEAIPSDKEEKEEFGTHRLSQKIRRCPALRTNNLILTITDAYPKILMRTQTLLDEEKAKQPPEVQRYW